MASLRETVNQYEEQVFILFNNYIFNLSSNA
jgi:hypothetical protein